MSLDAGSRIGPYDVVSLLGSGGMGEVYRARDSRLQRDVAIKILPPAFASDPDRLARFEREAQVLASLNHPNIGAIYGFVEGPPEGGPHVRGLVLELVEGATLADRIAQGPIPLDEALPIAKQIADALEAAHEHGVIHRDLKPANIKLRPDGTVKVLDFGLAKLHDSSASSAASVPNALSLSPTVMSPAVTQMGIILGTAAYMSPEQARGKAVDRRADIWAFGCILYEMVSGTAPFTGEDISLTLSSVLQRHVDWTALPPAARPVVPLLERCLEKDPRRRLRDIGEACVALDPESLRRSAGAPPNAGARSRGVPASLAAGAVLGAAVLTGAAAWTLRPAASDSVRPPVVRLSVTLPPGESIAAQGFFGASSWAPLAVSPDGSQLAYVSGPRLVLRAMNSLEVRTPQGTDEAQSPFFSPDGQWVAFFAQGQLKKVSIAGGLAASVTDAPVGAGGARAEDGSIYFAPTNMTGLMKVSSEGGEAVAVTTLDRSKGEVSHRWPQVLPGGTQLLFTVWRGPGWDEMDVQVQDLTTGQRTVLVRGANTGRYLRSGHLVYTRAGDLTAVPFDLERLAVTGAPVSLGVEVQEQEGAHYTVSDGGLLAYVPGHGQRQHKLIAVSKDGAAEDLGAPIRAYEDVVPSPDGRRLAVTVQGGSWGIWVFDPARKTESLLTRGSPTSQWPVWTADGARVIYRGTRDGSRNLYWRRADGTGEEERLTTSDLIETPTSVTPDGKWLVYAQTHPRTGSDIWLLPLDGTGTAEALMTSAASENDPQFSPDGRWLAFTSNDSGRDQVYVQPFPGPGERVVVSTDGGFVPRWARDGRRLFYLEGESLMAVDMMPAATLRVGAPRRLASTTGRLAEFEPLPDGRFAAIERTQPPESSTQIHVVVNWFEELAERVAARR